jgi:hypothetical protein
MSMNLVWNRMTTTRSINLLLGMIACSTLSAPASAADCEPFKFEVRDSVSLQNLARLLPPKDVNSKKGSITYSEFDEEDRPSSPDWYAVGLLYAGNSYIAMIPLGGFLWIRRDAILTTSFATNSTDDSVSAEFDAQRPGCAKKSFKIALKSNRQVFADDKPIGLIN